MIMRAYRIYYYAPLGVNELRDVFIAESKIKAIKDFIIENKGKYNVAFRESSCKRDRFRLSHT